MRTSLTAPGVSVNAGGVVNLGGDASGGATGSRGTDDCTGASCASRYGMPCESNRDCPSGSTCRDGSDEGGDATRLPVGDDTNVGELVVSADSLTVTDSITGLVWQRDGGTPKACFTDADFPSCTWAQAKAYCSSLVLGGVSGWRLPGVIELFTIVKIAPPRPSIDRTAFPNTSATFFWTSSPNTSSDGDAWCVEFSKGSSHPGLTCDGVRCVRGSRCYPTTRFVALDLGRIHDTLTNLVWQKQASNTKMDWWDADATCPAGFRLPTLKELMSIVDLTVTTGARINPKMFPGTRPEQFWTSSRSADIPNWAWAVRFDLGWPHELPGDAAAAQRFGLDSQSWVRCVQVLGVDGVLR